MVFLRPKARGDAVIRFREEARKLLAAMTSARRTFRLGSRWVPDVPAGGRAGKVGDLPWMDGW